MWYRSARKEGSTKEDKGSSSGSEPSSSELKPAAQPEPQQNKPKPFVPSLRLGGEGPSVPTPAPAKVIPEATPSPSGQSPKISLPKKPFVPKLSLDGAPPPNMSLSLGGSTSGSGEFTIPKPALKLPVKRESSPDKSPKGSDEKDSQSPKALVDKKLALKRIRPKSMVMTLPSMEEREEAHEPKEVPSNANTNRGDNDLDKELENALAGLNNTTPKSMRSSRGNLDLDKELEATLKQLNSPMTKPDASADDLDKALQSLTDEMNKKDSARTDLDATLKSLTDDLEKKSDKKSPKDYDSDSDGPKSAPLQIAPAPAKKKMAIPLLRLDDSTAPKRNSLPLSLVVSSKEPKTPKSPKSPKTPKTPKTPKEKSKKSPKDKDKTSPKDKSSPKDKGSPKDKTPRSSRGDGTPKDGSPRSSRKSPKSKSNTFSASTGKKVALSLNLGALADDGPKAMLIKTKSAVVDAPGDAVKKSTSNPAMKKFAIPSLNVVEKGLDYSSLAAEKEKGSQSPKSEKVVAKPLFVPRLAVTDKADVAAAKDAPPAKPKIPKLSAADDSLGRKKNLKEKRSTIHQDSFFKPPPSSKEHGDGVGDKIDWDFLGKGSSKDKMSTSTEKMEKSASEKTDLNKLGKGSVRVRDRKNRGSFSGSQTSASM
jgi:hypothetical protein